MRRYVPAPISVLALWLMLSAGPPSAMAGEVAEDPAPVAIADFNYVDTSGEPRDQTAEHQTRLQAFMLALRRDLERGGRYRPVPVLCAGDPCSIARAEPAELLDASRHAGARLLLLGGIHKMSTLVQSAKVVMIDLQSDRPVLDRWLSFRGDTDESWQRAEQFLVEVLGRAS
jgi:hypothetical protein